MVNTYERDWVEFTEVLCSVREYLQYLMDSGIHDASLADDTWSSHDELHFEEEESSKVRIHSRLEKIREEMGNCARCKLASSRTNIVFGEGNPHAKIVFVGEGPGYEEDQTGRPFVGNAGKKLTEIIEHGMGMSRSEVYICNIVKCRPPQNRDPQEDEINACLPILEKQIDAIRPCVIITLGLPAASTLVGVKHSMTQARGKWHSYKDIPVMPTYHPSFVLRNYTVAVRRQVWNDVRMALRTIEDGKA